MRSITLLLPALVAFLVGAVPALAWTWPVVGPVLQPFSLEGDPYAAGQHRGIDIGAAEGAPVRAPASGVVSFAGAVPGGGRSVTVLTPDGIAVTLLHLGSIEVTAGDTLAEGDRVGLAGWSGEPEHDVPSVHLGIRVGDDPHGYLDPLALLPEAPSEEAVPVGAPPSEPPASQGEPPLPAAETEWETPEVSGDVTGAIAEEGTSPETVVPEVPVETAPPLVPLQPLDPVEEPPPLEASPASEDAAHQSPATPAIAQAAEQRPSHEAGPRAQHEGDGVTPSRPRAASRSTVTRDAPLPGTDIAAIHDRPAQPVMRQRARGAHDGGRAREPHGTRPEPAGEGADRGRAVALAAAVIVLALLALGWKRRRGASPLGPAVPQDDPDPPAAERVLARGSIDRRASDTVVSALPPSRARHQRGAHAARSRRAGSRRRDAERASV